MRPTHPTFFAPTNLFWVLAQEMWDALGVLNDSLAEALTALTTLHDKSSGAYQAAVTKLVELPPDKVRLYPGGRQRHSDLLCFAHPQWETMADKNEITQAFVTVHKYTEASVR